VTLVGVVDPSHKEMARDTLGRLPEWLPLGEALHEAEVNSTKWSPWTYELMHAIFEEKQERYKSISASSLVDHCTRADIIGRMADYVDDLENLYVPFRGTMIHRTMELYAHDDTIAEHRFFTTVNGIEISCSPDWLTRTTLGDYKVTENPPAYNNPWTNHQEQVQINAFITRNATSYSPPGYGPREMHKWDGHDGSTPLPFDPRAHPATKLVLVYMGPKKPKTLLVERTTDYFDFKKGKDVRGKQPFVQTDEQVLEYLAPRVEMFQRALEVFPEWPDGAEKVWGGEPGWTCPGYPLCKLPNCLAKRWPGRLMW
jgi:hypothetical protein